ncbi:hypothetical protein [Azospirillum sp.]|uniref:hypothetical protein n=1 Tax=Azospirillum sp. TaxID=34012 RepID=UPI002D4786F9|nr:hypothetical protein [Azospirillum sp.]HYD70865.1 hypothetical protein [Azospirillum sp.]
MAHAHYLVAEKATGWFITMEESSYGPFPGGRNGALIAAVQAAQQAGKDGHDAHVRLRAADGTVNTAWTFGSDPYPPPWAEEARNEAATPRRASSRPAVLAGVSAAAGPPAAGGGA